MSIASSSVDLSKGKSGWFDCEATLFVATHALLVLNLVWSALWVGYPIARMAISYMSHPSYWSHVGWFFDTMLALHDHQLLTVCMGIVVWVGDCFFYLLIRSAYGGKLATLYAVMIAAILSVAAWGCYSCLYWEFV